MTRTTLALWPAPVADRARSCAAARVYAWSLVSPFAIQKQGMNGSTHTTRRLRRPPT